MPKQLSRATPMSQNRNEQSAKHQTQALSPSTPPMTKAGIRLAGKEGNAPLSQAGNEGRTDQACEKEENMTYDHKKKQSTTTDLEDRYKGIIRQAHASYTQESRGNMTIMRETENIKRPKWNF